MVDLAVQRERADAGLRKEARAVFAAIGVFAGPDAPLGDGLHDESVVTGGFLLRPRVQDAYALAEQFAGRVAEIGFQRGVGQSNRLVRPHEHHAFRHRLQHQRLQPQRGLRAPQLRDIPQHGDVESLVRGGQPSHPRRAKTGATVPLPDVEVSSPHPAGVQRRQRRPQQRRAAFLLDRQHRGAGLAQQRPRLVAQQAVGGLVGERNPMVVVRQHHRLAHAAQHARLQLQKLPRLLRLGNVLRQPDKSDGRPLRVANRNGPIPNPALRSVRPPDAIFHGPALLEWLGLYPLAH